MVNSLVHINLPARLAALIFQDGEGRLADDELGRALMGLELLAIKC